MELIANLKKNWSAQYRKKMGGSKEDVWKVISMQNNLNYVHPFCKKNEIILWDGEKSKDILVYLNDLTFIREFLSWEENRGYSLIIGEKNKQKSYVEWKIDTIDDDTYLTITVYPYFIKNLPRFITFLPYYLFVIPKLKSYLKSVINGIDYYIKTKKPIPKNYFGKHSWFS